MIKTLVAVIAAVSISACGSATKSPQDQIKATSHAYIDAVRHDRLGPACRLTSDQGNCLETFAAARALGVKPSDTLRGTEDKRIDAMKVTVDGDRAHDQRGTRFVKRDDRWLLVLRKS